VGFRWGLYAAALLVPFAGIVVALFLFEAESMAARRVGRNCLLTGFLAWVLFPAMILALLVLAVLVAAAGFLAEFAPLDP
jgi:hypothetical protein